jgi:hypothetical protein
MTNEQPSDGPVEKPRQYPTPVTDQREMAGWMRREQEAYEQGKADCEAAHPAAEAMTNRAGASSIDAIMYNAIRYRLTLDDVSDAMRRADIEWLLSRADAAHPATEGLDATRLVAELGKARDALMELLLAAQDMDDGITEHGWAIQKARAVLGLSPEGQEK